MSDQPSVPAPSTSKPAGFSTAIPKLKPLADLSLEDRMPPVDPTVLADAMRDLNTLRSTKTPAGSAAPSAATSPAASGSNSPNPAGQLQLDGVEKVLQQGTTNVPVAEAPRVISAPNTPHFGAQTELLRTLDDATKVLRQSSKAPTRAPSVSGIGAVIEKPDYSEAKIVVAMVGLPARGKSYLSNRLMRYLRWLEYKVDVFNVGQLRRSKARAEQQQGGEKVDHSADYFSASNEKGQAIREQLASESLESLISWLKKEGNVGIMDATNSTFERREKIRKRVAQEPGLQLLFLESFCNDPAVIAANVLLKARSGDPDYAGMSEEEAQRDFKKRIEAYERVYQTITEPGISFCRILNVGQQVTINRIDGYLQSRIAFYLMNLHLKPRHIYLSRHGESMYNVEGKIGGDSDISPQGWQYAKALPDLVRQNIGDGPLEVWTSTLQRTIQTGSFLPFEHKTWKSLDELDAGVCDGMTYEEIEEKYPEDYEARDEDKFNYRYRGGESYRDVVVRLEPVIMELERQENIMIIAHQAILRSLYAYFMALSQEELPYIKIPLHTLIKITPMAYGCHEERYPLPIAAVDTHRPNPKKHAADPADASGTPASVPAEKDKSVARDYFGAAGAGQGVPAAELAKGQAAEGSGSVGTGPGVHAGQVSMALEKDLEKGGMTPKAANSEI